MKKNEAAKMTGISGITGKMVRVRHANEDDIFFIKEMLERHGIASEEIDYSEFMIAFENGFPIGCGRIRRTDGFSEISCVEIVKEQLGNGIDALIVQHLLEDSALEKVYVVTDRVETYRKLGFREISGTEGPLEGSLAKVCRPPRGKEIAMLYEKKGSV